MSGTDVAADRRAPWTLRRRIVVAIVAIVLLLSGGIGVASVAILNGFLQQRVDDQLEGALERSRVLGDSGGRGPGDSDGDDGPRSQAFVLAPGLPVGTVAAVVRGSAIDSDGAILRTTGAAVLTADQAEDLVRVPSASTPVTVDLGALGDYRVVAVPVTQNERVVIGLPLSEARATVAGFGAMVAGIAVLAVLLVAAVTGGIVSLALRPLRRVTAAATEVASLPLDRGEVALAVRVPDGDTDPRTEVGQVGAALNNLLSHVDAALRSRQASESRVRQFVADASHELRTPLASIRGYAELTRRGGHTLPPDVVHSLGRVESEAVRMTSLVEDLLLLARLDSGRDLELAPVDLSRLLVDCVSDAHAAGPEHEWELVVPDEPVIAPADSQRIHQVLANLLANARVHTPAGTHVTVTLTRTDDSAVIAVSDTGPGIPEALRADLFERFARGDSSRSRVAGSTGLGLSIVRAVVEAHHGEVGVESSDDGTTFTVTLPLVVG